MNDKLPLYAMLVWETAQDRPTRLEFGDPLAALLSAASYLADGYHVRLTDPSADAAKAVLADLFCPR